MTVWYCNRGTLSQQRQIVPVIFKEPLRGDHSMHNIHDPPEQLEVHDPDILANARSVLNACRSPQEMQEAVLAAVQRNEEWRGR
jgi:hypothetical protein